MLKIMRIDLVNRSLNICFIVGGLFLWDCAGTPPVPPEPEPVAVYVPEPEPVVVVPPTPPEVVLISSIEYNKDHMTINWDTSQDADFISYTLIRTIGESNNIDTLVTIKDIERTVYELEDFDPKIENWFWILVTDQDGLVSEGKRSTHTLETKAPEAPILLSVEYDDMLTIRWNQNQDHDFSFYRIYRSRLNSMNDKVPFKDIFSKTDTLFIIPTDSVYYYQIGVQDHWGLESYSNILKGDHSITIWNQEYSLIDARELDLSSSKRFGEIPSEFSRLINLEDLRLQNNFLTGRLPDGLWELKKLRSINVSNNELSGKIPKEIYRASSSLEELWLSNNKFTGELPYQLFMLKNLTHLNISDNEIEGYLSESVSDLVSLEYLNLWNNNISGFIPRELGELKNLEFLSLSGNQLKGPIPKELGNASSLISIGLFENELTGSIPKEITTLSNLKYLGLFDNKLEGDVPEPLMSQLDLLYLRLNDNNFDEIDHDSMCGSGYDWANFIYYDVSKNEFGEPLPVCFHNDEFLKIYSSYNKK